MLVLAVRVHSRRVRLPVDPARHRHETLRITPHAVLADVEPFQLLAGRDAKSDGLLDDPEQAIAQDEDARESDHDRDRLRAELVEASRVEQATLANAVDPGEGGHREQATAERAPDARQAVSRKRTDRVIEPAVDDEHTDDHDHPRDGADDDRGPRLDIA